MTLVESYTKFECQICGITFSKEKKHRQHVEKQHNEDKSKDNFDEQMKKAIELSKLDVIQPQTVVIEQSKVDFTQMQAVVIQQSQIEADQKREGENDSNNQKPQCPKCGVEFKSYKQMKKHKNDCKGTKLDEKTNTFVECQAVDQKKQEKSENENEKTELIKNAFVQPQQVIPLTIISQLPYIQINPNTETKYVQETNQKVIQQQPGQVTNQVIQCFPCDHCNETFQHKQLLLSHLQSCSLALQRLYRCGQCQLIFQSIYILMDHDDLEHQQQRPVVKVDEIDITIDIETTQQQTDAVQQLQTLQNEDLDSHQDCSKAKPQCSKCGTQFNNKKQMNKHQRGCNSSKMQQKIENVVQVQAVQKKYEKPESEYDKQMRLITELSKNDYIQPQQVIPPPFIQQPDKQDTNVAQVHVQSKPIEIVIQVNQKETSKKQGNNKNNRGYRNKDKGKNKNQHPNPPPEENSRCNHCDQQFDHQLYMQTHLKTCVLAIQDLYKCSECEVLLPSAEQRVQHEVEHRQPPKPQISSCPRCYIAFPCQAEMRQHTMSCIAYGDQRCDMCSPAVMFLTPQNLQFHIQMQHPICSLCAMQFRSRRELDYHLQQCQIQHVAIAENTCPICKFRFISQTELKSHLVWCQTEPGHVPVASQMGEPFMCGCGTLVIGKRGMEAHAEAAHSGWIKDW